MDGTGRAKMSRDLSPDLAKVAMQARVKQARKLQVVYYLSRGGQLEHPHFVEVLVPSNQDLKLRDVMDRLTALRGKGMPSLFSWSCKRSYKSGYVWNDLSEEDIIYPADGFEYVLKGSELFEGCSERCQETKTSSSIMNSQERSLSSAKVAAVPKQRSMMEQDIHAQDQHVRGHHRLPPNSKPQSSQNVTVTHKKITPKEEDPASLRSENPLYRPKSEDKSSKPSKEYKVFKSETMDNSPICQGADAATQTREDILRCTRVAETVEEEQSKESEYTQNSIELSGGEQSPPSSTSSEAHNINRSTDITEEVPHTKPASIKSVRFEEPNISLSSRFSLLQLFSCGSLGVDDNNILVAPLKTVKNGPATDNSLHNTKDKNQSHDDNNMSAVNRTIGEELDCMSENHLSFAMAQIAEKQYFSGSFVEGKTEAEAEAEEDPTLNRSASFNAERKIKSEMVGNVAKEGNDKVDSVKTKCIPRKKSSRKELKNQDVKKTPFKGLRTDRNMKGSWSNRFP